MLHSRLYYSRRLTPRPLTKRHMRLINKPGGPSTNLFTKPNARTGNGTRTPNGTMDALKRSSGYQTPPLFLRHLITVRSEILPIIGAPTERSSCQRNNIVCSKAGPRTHISDTCRYETSADQCFVRDIVTNTLNLIG
jgi:hypothetical protein